ncbi:MAG: hypothetical protein Q9163_003568 [Psora crenata]
MQRKDEILAKKAKLAELRRQREEREQRQKEGRRESLLDDGSGVKVPTPRRSTDRQELDSFIETLVGDRPGSRGPGTGTASPAGKRSRPTSTLSAVQVGSETYEQAQGTVTPPNYATAATQTSETKPLQDSDLQAPIRSRSPVEVVTYSKAVQTAEEWSPQRAGTSNGEDPSSDLDGEDDGILSMRSLKRLTRRQKEREEELRQNLRKEIEEELRAAKDPSLDGQVLSIPSKFPARELTNEELNAMVSSDDFLEFVERSSKVIEKALDQDYDVLADYALDGIQDVSEDDEGGYGNSRGTKARRIRQIAQFFDERWSRKRMISDMGFSPKKFPELLLAAYTKNASAPQDPAGLLQIWNMHLHSRPEYSFHSTSDILAAKFSPFHPSLIIGGTYSGQVLLWDTRSRTPHPVQKTPLTGASSGGHTHPVYSISLVGTQNANNIISCSTDGIICGWTTDMLTLPQEYLELTTPPPSKTEDLSPTCMSFPVADPTSFLVGTEEGTIYPCHRYDRAGAKAGVDARLRYKAHSAPVMSLDYHPARGPVDLGDLVLSSGLDWTVKLWKTRPASSTAVAAASNPVYGELAANQEQAVEPLIDISREDVVYDARWSPHKPGVFSLVDGGGNVEVWDLTVDSEVPIAKSTPQADHDVHGPFVAKSLNKVVWEEKEGKRLAVGGAAGIVTVFEVGSDLAGESVKNEEWTRMKRCTEDHAMAAMAAAASTPFAANYYDPAQHIIAREDLRIPASQPKLRDGASPASSVNNIAVDQPWSFSMGDSSDDETSVRPMKFSAEVKLLLGDEASILEGSSPPQTKVEPKPIMHLDRPLRKHSPLISSGRIKDGNVSPVTSRNASPRVVRLKVGPAQPLRKTAMMQNETSPVIQQRQDLITPAPRPRSHQSLLSKDQWGGKSSDVHEAHLSDILSAKSEPQFQPSRGSREDSTAQEAESQLANLSINRTHGEDASAHTAQRQKRVQVTGRFLKGPARRGIKRRQSEEEPSPNVATLPFSESHLRTQKEAPGSSGVLNGRSASSAPTSHGEGSEGADQQRPAHVRFQSQANIITGSPEQKVHQPAKTLLTGTAESKSKNSANPRPAGEVVWPIFKVPPLPPLPSRHDQENEPPPTFKRNKRDGVGLGDDGIFSIAQDEKMLIQTPGKVSPSRPALAARSQNTPRRPAPPPPKMSVLETATATAGAASVSQSKKKRNFMSVNGKMFTRMNCIGRGGSSKVYRVMAENYKIFALKRVMLEDQDELAIRGYKGEIDLLRKLEKVERVVTLFDYEINEDKHTLSVLMEMGESDLSRILIQLLNTEDASFDITSARYFWKEMLECVSSVHALNIVHSDLKPANFLLLKGRLKLIDFGISNTIADDTVNVHREQHIGTPNYMSPEALIDSNAAAGLPSSEGKMMKLGKPSDVWSLGCILYQMVYGKPPFAHIANQMQRIMAIPNPRHAIAFPESGLGGVFVPAGLIRTLKRCLNRDQTLRPTVDELLSPTDPFLYPDVVLRDTVPVGRELIARLQNNILKHIKEKGMPTEQELAIWPERFFKSIKAAVEEGRA